MDLEKLFESIYEASNYTTETETSSLESPMESKPFEEIYFECNLKPLFERVLREMAQPEPSSLGDIIMKKIFQSYYDLVDNPEILVKNAINLREELSCFFNFFRVVFYLAEHLCWRTLQIRGGYERH